MTTVVSLPLDPASAHAAQRYLRLHACLMAIAASALSVLLACVLLGDVLRVLPPQGLLPLGLALLGVVVALLPFALRLGLQVRCPHCGKHCFVHRRLTTGGALHAPRSIDIVMQRLGIAQLRARQCGCVHCGAGIEWDQAGPAPVDA